MVLVVWILSLLVVALVARRVVLLGVKLAYNYKHYNQEYYMHYY